MIAQFLAVLVMLMGFVVFSILAFVANNVINKSYHPKLGAIFLVMFAVAIIYFSHLTYSSFLQIIQDNNNSVEQSKQLF